MRMVLKIYWSKGWYQVGLPAKSGVSGSLVLVVPGVMGVSSPYNLKKESESFTKLQICYSSGTRIFPVFPFSRLWSPFFEFGIWKSQRIQYFLSNLPFKWFLIYFLRVKPSLRSVKELGTENQHFRHFSSASILSTDKKAHSNLILFRLGFGVQHWMLLVTL